MNAADDGFRAFGHAGAPEHPLAPEHARVDGRPRIPPGQGVTRGFPVLHVGSVPTCDLADWTLSVTGAVEHPLRLDGEAFRREVWREQRSDFHCVTGWSRLDCRWRGVPLSDLIRKAAPARGAAWVLLLDGRGYGADVPLEVALDKDTLLAAELDGVPLEPRHGGPCRVVIPDLYGWKSTKWLREVRILERPASGYWEARGYHPRGDPWLEERVVG